MSETKPDDSALAVLGNAGITKREAFALMAMQGLCSDPQRWKDDELAQKSVEIADALIERLNKNQ